MWIKRVICILLVVLCLPFSGCSSTSNEPTKSSSVKVRISEEWPRMLTEEEILAFAAGEMPYERRNGAVDGFVVYDEIRIMGDLCYLSVQPYRRDHYIYELIDRNGYRFHFEIMHPGQSMDFMENDVRKHTIDISAAETGESGYVVQNGVIKKYLDKELKEIWFCVDGDGLWFGISHVHFRRMLSDYPKRGQKTILFRLINGTEEEAQSALQEFENWFYEHRPQNEWLLPAGIGLVAGVLGVGGLVLWKKKYPRRKKMA